MADRRKIYLQAKRIAYAICFGLFSLIIGLYGFVGIVNRARLDDDLYTAVIQNNTGRVRYLLAAGANPNVCEHSMHRPSSLFSWLVFLSHHHEKEQKGQSALIAAASNGNDKIVQLLIKNGANVNYVNPDPDGLATPLIAAVESDQPRIVERVLNAGADPNRCRNDGCSPFWIAIYSFDHHHDVEIIMLLLKHGVHFSVNSSTERQMLFHAASRHDTSVLDALLATGVSVDVVNSEGVSLLSATAYVGNFNGVKLLFLKGAKISKEGMHSTLLWVKQARAHISQKGATQKDTAEYDAIIALLKRKLSCL